MILERVLSYLRRLIDQTDLASANILSDLELLEFLRDAAETLGMRKIEGMDAFEIVELIQDPNYGITPEPTTEQAHLMCLAAAIAILAEQYRGKLNRGELGVNWTSGLESESTGSAVAAWGRVIQGYQDDLDLMITFNKSGRHGTRVQ